MPRVSVIMPVYNGERYVREAMESILSQTFTDFEFIIVDDGSTDGTPNILKSYDDPRIIRLHHETNEGIVYSLNQALEIVRGEFIARQDADDISMPERLEQQVSVLCERPEVAIVGSAYYLIRENGAHIRIEFPPIGDTVIRWRMLFHNSLAHTSVIFRSAVVHQHRLRYGPEALPSEDYDLWGRMLCYGEGLNIGQPLVKHRVHWNRISHVAAAEQGSTANRISRSNLERLGLRVCLSDSDVRTLRCWHNGFLQSLNREDMLLCRVLVRILREFEKQQDVDRGIVRELRVRLIDRMLAAIPADRWMDICASGLVASLLRVDAHTVLNHISKRAIRRVGRVLQTTSRV